LKLFEKWIRAIGRNNKRGGFMSHPGWTNEFPDGTWKNLKKSPDGAKMANQAPWVLEKGVTHHIASLNSSRYLAIPETPFFFDLSIQRIIKASSGTPSHWHLIPYLDAVSKPKRG
jgi:hypothetical protein